VPIWKRVEVIGEFFNHRSQFQRCGPFRRDTFCTTHSAEQVAGDRAGGIRVAVMVHGQDEALPKIRGHHGAIDRDGERIIGDEAGAEPPDGVDCRYS
jgi:hypothetical protein